MPIQEEILEILKQKMIPELGDLKASIIQIQADIKVMNGRLNQMERTLEELRADVRELRSYMFTSKMGESKYQVREK